MALSLITPHSWLPIILSVISRANGNDWTINATRHTEASFGSNTSIRCQFTHPSAPSLRDVNVFWMKEEFNDRRTGDLNPFIFHHDSSQVMEAYRGRTALTGNVQNGDCSLFIQNVTTDESRLYVRVRAVKFYSFYNYPVSIKVTEIAAKEVVITTSSQTSTRYTIIHPTETTPILATAQTPASSSTPVIYYFAVPIAALFIVAIVASVGFLVHRKYSRLQSLDRSSSGSYLNFTRESTNPNNGVLSALTRCPPQHEGLKVIDDEPVYSNVQPDSHPPSWTADVDESIYANV